MCDVCVCRRGWVQPVAVEGLRTGLDLYEHARRLHLQVSPGLLEQVQWRQALRQWVDADHTPLALI